MDFMEQRNGQAHHERHEDYIKPKYQTGEDASDRSLSSWRRRPFATKTGVGSSFIDVHRQSRLSAVDETPTHMLHIECFLFPFLVCLILSRAPACHFHATRPINVCHPKKRAPHMRAHDCSYLSDVLFLTLSCWSFCSVCEGVLLRQEQAGRHFFPGRAASRSS